MKAFLLFLILATVSIAAEPTSGTFKSKAYGCQIRYPIDLKSFKIQDKDNLLNLYGSLKGEKLEFNLTINKDPSFKTETPKEFTTGFTQEIVERMASLRFENAKVNALDTNFVLDGQPAVFMILSGLIDGHKRTTVSISALHGGILYTLKWDMATEAVPGFSKDIYSMADSFHHTAK